MNELIYAPVTEKMLCQILEKPWSVTQQELESWGGEPRSLVEYLHNSADVQTAIVTMGETIPVCAFGGQKIEGRPDEVVTWFLGSSLFPSVGRAATRMIRRSMRQMAKDIGVSRIVTVSGSEHEDAPKWFRVLGYSLESAEVGAVGSARRYVTNL